MRRLVILGSLLLACHEEPAPDLLDPTCGAEGPVALLHLEPGEEVQWVWRVDEPGDLMVHVSGAPDDPTAEPHAVVVDRCGDTRTELAASYSTLLRWHGGLLGCHQGALVWLTGYADPSPTTLAQGCSLEPAGTLRLTYDIEPEQSTGRLLSLEAVGPHVEARVLVENTVGTWPVVIGDHALVQTADGRVLRVDPRTGEQTLELPAAGSWSANERTIAYRPAGDSAEPGPLVLRDRQTGAEQTIDAALPDTWRLQWWTEEVLVATPPGPRVGLRWFGRSPARELLPPEGTSIATVRSDGLVWLSRPGPRPGQLELLRWHEPEPPQVGWTCSRCTFVDRPTEGALDVVVPSSDPGRRDLWRIDDAGGTARRLAASIGDDYLVLDDERVLSVIPHPADQTGPLHLHDGSRVTLAPSVHRRSIDWTLHYHGDDEIVYVSHDDDAPTLWRAVLSP